MGMGERDGTNGGGGSDVSKLVHEGEHEDGETEMGKLSAPERNEKSLVELGGGRETYRD